MSTSSMALTYTALSTRSTFRNTRFVIFTMALPLILYVLFNSLYGRDGDVTGGLTTGAYLMVSMAAYGGLGATINAGARVAIERQTGWNRQLRLTALSPRAYILSKTVVALLVALPAILLVFLAGRLLGHVGLPATTWLATGAALWLTLIPFAVLGLTIGFLGTTESIQPLTMLIYLAMSILGGLWFPVDQLSSFFQNVAHGMPSYWVAEISRTVLVGGTVPVRGVLILAAWTAGLGLLGALAYRRSGRRA